MNGPKAPKDAAAHRPYFYIMQDKEVFGQKWPDGTFCHPIYENDGRLISSARITGNITDEDMLNMLLTTDGFRKLVHSIGISAETKDPEDRVTFAFQMYGAKDIYGGGSTLITDLTGNGVEVRINVEDFPKNDDEKEPGQIRFRFYKPETLATVKVRFFLNDGYTAPEPIEDNPVDTESDSYREMIKRSLFDAGNLARLRSVCDRASKGEDVTIGYIGGSITQGAGATPINKQCYAWKSFEKFKALTGGGDNVHYVKVGVGGTPSQLGVVRFERDLIIDGVIPDLVVVEFAVNDEGDETKGVCFESLIKKILKLPNNPAVVILFAVFANDWNLQDRLSPAGRKYEVPMVSVLDAVSPQFGLTPEKGRVVSKNRFFYDRYHPTNVGHTIMADCLAYMFEQALTCETKDRTEELLKQAPAIGNTFEDIVLLDKLSGYAGAKISTGDFTETDTELQNVEKNLDLFGSPEFPYNWMYKGNKSAEDFEEFKLEIECKSLMILFKDSGALDVGACVVTVDGKDEFVLDPHLNGWVHCNHKIIIDEAAVGKHTVTVRPVAGDEAKKFTILCFGYTL